MSLDRCISDDLPCLLMLEGVLAAIAPTMADARVRGDIDRLRPRLRADAERCAADEFEAIVFWLRAGPEGAP